MATPTRKPRDPNAPKRSVPAREYLIMYRGEGIEMLGVAANAKEALDKILAGEQFKVFKFTPPRVARKPATA